MNQYEQISLDNTKVSRVTDSLLVTQGKRVAEAVITVSQGDARMAVLSDPTTSVGLLLKAGNTYLLTGYKMILEARFIATGASSVLDIQYLMA